jgi:hypothetical protein
MVEPVLFPQNTAAKRQTLTANGMFSSTFHMFEDMDAKIGVVYSLVTDGCHGSIYPE